MGGKGEKRDRGKGAVGEGMENFACRLRYRKEYWYEGRERHISKKRKRPNGVLQSTIKHTQRHSIDMTQPTH